MTREGRGKTAEEKIKRGRQRLCEGGDCLGARKRDTFLGLPFRTGFRAWLPIEEPRIGDCSSRSCFAALQSPSRRLL